MKLSTIASLLLASSLAAQGLHVAPREFANADAPALTAVAGIGVSDREQILIDASHLTEIAGHRVTGLVFRRDASDPNAFAGGAGSIVVRIGPAAFQADSARPDFLANLPSATEVFRGPIQIPASPAPAGVPPWNTPHVVEIQFTTPYLYQGGDLCIDVTGSVAAEFWWSVDAAEEATLGSVVSEGHACGPLASVHGDTAAIAEHDLVVGETVICSLFGQPGASAFLLMGLDTLPSPLDLVLIGAPGCELRVDPFLAAASVVSPPPLNPIYGGIAECLLHVPADARLLGAGFVTQWCEFPAGGLATSNTLRCTLAGTRPNLHMAVVWSRGGGEPIVQFTRVPVVGFRWE